MLRSQLVPGGKVEFSDYLVGLILVLGGKKSIFIPTYFKLNSSIAKFQRSVVLTLVLKGLVQEGVSPGALSAH